MTRAPLISDPRAETGATRRTRSRLPVVCVGLLATALSSYLAGWQRPGDMLLVATWATACMWGVKRWV